MTVSVICNFIDFHLVFTEETSLKSTTWSQIACSANQRPKITVKKKSPQTFARFVNFSKMCLPCLIIMKSCYIGCRINKLFTCSHCVICVSCSVHVISTYYVCKGSWAFFVLITWHEWEHNSSQPPSQWISRGPRTRSQVKLQRNVSCVHPSVCFTVC